MSIPNSALYFKSAKDLPLGMGFVDLKKISPEWKLNVTII